MPSSNFQQEHGIVGHPIFFLREANLVQFDGYARAKRMTDHEGSGEYEFHVEIHNPDPVERVRITHAEWYHGSARGWLTNGPWPMIPPEPSVAQPLLPADVIEPGGTLTFERLSWQSFRLSHQLFMFRLETSRAFQNLIGQLPIGYYASTDWTLFPPGLAPSLPFGHPDLLPLSAPVFLTLMEDLAVIPVDDGPGSWLPVTGQIVNGSGARIRITELNWTLEAESGERTRGSFPLVFLEGGQYHDISGVFSAEKVIAFNHVLENLDRTGWRTLSIEAKYQLEASRSGIVGDHTAGATQRTARLGAPDIPDFTAPVGAVEPSSDDLWWGVWNGPQQSGFNLHNGSPSSRFAYDLILGTVSSTSRPMAPQDNNDSFYAYRRPVLAMADGEVVNATDEFPENNGRTPVPGTGNNGLVIRHGQNLYASYAHTRPHSIAEAGVVLGQHVRRGQKIAEVGNAGGSSEPHLHITCCRFDEQTGVAKAVPLVWPNTHNVINRAFRGVLPNGSRFRVRNS